MLGQIKSQKLHAKWLVNNGNLYKDEGVTLMTPGLRIIQMPLFDSDDNDQILDGSKNVVNCNAEGLNRDTKCKGQQTVCHVIDTGVKMKQKCLLESLTLCYNISSPDFVTDNKRQHILNVAP